MFGTRQILKGFYALLAAEVNDKEMRSRSTLLCLPVGGLLQVEDLVA